MATECFRLKSLLQWESDGFLRVLADPETAVRDTNFNVVCLELNYYVDNQGCRAEFRKDYQEYFKAVERKPNAKI